MIVRLNGILLDKSPSEIVIDVHGVGYLCYISNNTYNNLPNLKQKVSLLIYHQISENNQNLYDPSKRPQTVTKTKYTKKNEMNNKNKNI